MTRPIQAGDVCEVINGVYRGKSPNVGKVVTVKSLQGNHTQLGVIWRCIGKDLVVFNSDDVVGMAADFPAAWLRRIEPPAAPAQAIDLREKLAA